MIDWPTILAAGAVGVSGKILFDWLSRKRNGNGNGLHPPPPRSAGQLDPAEWEQRIKAIMEEVIDVRIQFLTAVVQTITELRDGQRITNERLAVLIELERNRAS